MTARDFLEALQEECEGAIPLHRYMREALYHPTFGYYAKNIRDVGRRGDFSTWPTLDLSLSRVIAHWVVTARNVIEVGAGTGTLARDTLKSLGWLARRRMSYHIVESSPPLREAQERLLRGYGVQWHEDLSSALSSVGGSAHVFSNELVDAFPCRVFQRRTNQWHEVALRLAGGQIMEILLPSSPLPESSVFSDHAPDGARVEVHESYRAWLSSWAHAWKAGALLTIDYGTTMPALTHRRPAGSLRAYAHHQMLTGRDVYLGFGKRDITADVNFTDLAAWGDALGWHTKCLMPLGEWMCQQSPGTRLSPAFVRAAEAFHVLVQTPPARERGERSH